MERDIRNKEVIITGGAEGLGYHFADSFLANGAKTVILLDINETLGYQAVDTLNNKHGTGKAIFMKCDVTTDLETVSDDIFNNFNVEVLVNNAGISIEEEIKRTISVNVTAVLEWSFKFFEHVRKDKGGSGGTIFNVSSIYGYDYDPWFPVYKTSKHGIIGFTKTLGHPSNYVNSGVRVICICPGFTNTSIGKKAKPMEFQASGFDEFMKKFIVQSPETVGKAAVEIFKVAETSTSWEIRDNKLIRQVKTH